ncbi:MAG: hypothetical protein GX794_01430 [Acholeplasmataceae bacterium]|jgi:hypothetical protein|nr:hypothetical protein [Acholeplasmataceae bacterium]
MKKLDEKLKELQEDIPKFPQDLDDKVFQAYEKHHDVKKNKLPSFLIPTLTSVTAIIIIVFLVQKFVGGVFDPFDVNTDPTSDSNDTTSLPTSVTSEPDSGGTDEPQLYYGFQAAVSVSIEGETLAPESTPEGNYGYVDIVLVKTHNELLASINKYAIEAHDVLNDVTRHIQVDDNYFDEQIVLIIPFAHTSSEKDIALTKVEQIDGWQPTNLYFDIFSPEFNDMDLLVEFHVATLSIYVLEMIEPNPFQIVINNLDDSSRGSVYYPLL